MGSARADEALAAACIRAVMWIDLMAACATMSTGSWHHRQSAEGHHHGTPLTEKPSHANDVLRLPHLFLWTYD